MEREQGRKEAAHMEMEGRWAHGDCDSVPPGVSELAFDGEANIRTLLE